MHIESPLAKPSIPRMGLCQLSRDYVKPDEHARRRSGRIRLTGGQLFDVLAANRELFRSLDAHLDAPSGTAQQRDQDGPVREELRERHGLIDSIRRLDDDRLIGAAAQDEHGSSLRQRAQRPGEGLSLSSISGRRPSTGDVDELFDLPLT